MKSTAIILIASLLFEILVPCASVLAQMTQGDKTVRVGQLDSERRSGRKQMSERDRVLAVAERAIRLIYELDVRVMSSGKLDVSKLRTGLIARVVHTSAGSKRAATGNIVKIGQDGITLWSAERPGERKKIPYIGIDTLVIARDRQALERWQRRAEGRFLVMSKSNLDLSKLTKGWHVFVVYEFENGTRAELTEILDGDKRHVLVGAPDTAAGQFWAKREIARDDIEIVVAAENPEDITGWRYARRLIPHLVANPKIRFKTWSFVEGGSKAKSVVGRLIDVNQDTFVIRGGQLRSNIHKLPLSSFTDFEISIGRRRNTAKGLSIGAGVSFLALLMWSAAFGPPDSGYHDQSEALRGLGYLSMVAAAALVGAMIGHSTETERWVEWVETSPHRLNLNLVPTQNRGLGAAVSFDF